MPERIHELIVFPTELALRRHQQELALEQGWVDASGHTTIARLRQLCLPYASLKGQRLRGAEELLLRREGAETAHGHFVEGGPLQSLSPAALAGVLEKLVAALAALPEETDRIVDWLLNHPPKHKLYQLGILFSIWRANLKQEGLCDQLDVNTAILRLLKGSRDKWPPLLRECKRISFRAVRWFNPFEEACVAALNHKLKVNIESALPPAYAEASGDRLGQRIRSEIMGRPWAVWAEDLSDALAVDSPDVLQLSDSQRINFSRSAGAYGEIEDLARRICWNTVEQGVPPNRIALVVPDIGAVQDIIPSVFSRFRIPYYFRRGRPVLSSPAVKALFSWLAFPLHAERDHLIDLVLNPAIRFDNREEEVERLLQEPPRLKGNRIPMPAVTSGSKALEIFSERMVEPEDHFNRSALQAVSELLEELADRPAPLAELVDLLEELLADATVRPRDSHEQGVWILNPHDAVGLEFDLVLFAGLNEGAFPAIPQQDALLNDKERYRLRLHLEEQGRVLPKMALPEASVLYEQESVMFLAALGMARGQIVLSYQAVDQEGGEKGGGEFFRKLWNVAGWCVRPDIRLSPYDQWRIGLLGEACVFAEHAVEQQAVEPEDRKPMPGESFLPIIPLPLCRAKDEALQAAVSGGTASQLSMDDEDVVPPGEILHLVQMLEIEAEREAFLETPVDGRPASIYCGHIESLKEKVIEWFAGKGELSPTALEKLAQNRYVFLLEHVFGLRDPRMADDMPDPMDRGTLIHSILREIYTAIAQGEAGIDAPRCWAVKTANGWMRRAEGGVDAIPLATVVHEHIEYAQEVARRRMDQALLGHPGIWAAEQEKMLEQIVNFVRYDVETCAQENRYPALFEHAFGGDTAVDLGDVRLKGKVDRIDLVFEDSGALSKVRVLDYKGTSRVRGSAEEYVEEVRRALDCQLPVYAFAAQNRFFGECNTDEANAMTEAGYLVYQRDRKEIGKVLKKSILSLDEPDMLSAFLNTVHQNMGRLKVGDFAVDPLIESYNDYESVCRTEAVTLENLD
jgi:RecB family exonuclease